MRRPGGTGRPVVVITGGGTAGHVLPALSIADALVADGTDKAAIEFIGARRGMETTLVPAAGYRLHALPGRGIERKVTLRAALAIASLIAAQLCALALLARRRPQVVVTVGGYAGFAGSLAAVVLRIPLVVVNVDAVPGAANRLVAPFARRCAVAFPDTPMPRATVTGAPVRPEVLAAAADGRDRDVRRAALGVDPQRHLVVVAGGSLGARRLNDAALGLALRWRDRKDVTIYHVSGDRDHASVAERRATEHFADDAIVYDLVAYERRLPELLAVCDLALCRAGASTVAELAVLGTPSVLVPLPGAPGDHQRRNAEGLERAGAARLVDDAAATPGSLEPLVSVLLDDPELLAEMSAAARGLGRPDAAAAIARICLDVASGRAR
jgi:UDP-N-acetylglucosamine--N-acetylmuramyl-(pentapeptide) pyrophosphoryl-undecaprenol N-acetylglucosamine transferase